MDFFSHQARSRRATRLLVVAFGLTLSLIVAATTLAAAVLLHLTGVAGRPTGGLAEWAQAHAGLLAVVAGGTAAILLLASLYRTATLARGGSEVARLLAGLEPREVEVLRLRYGLDRGEPRTLEEVGQAFGLTRERIRQIEARAISKLRHPSIEAGARDLLAV